MESCDEKELVGKATELINPDETSEGELDEQDQVGKEVEADFLDDES